MVDHERRKKLALHLRHLSIGLISNDAFENSVMDDVTEGWLPEQYYRSEKSYDDATITPMLEMCWQLYSNNKNYKLKGRYELPKESLEIIARCILFLHSDIEYQWPHLETGRLTTKDVILSLLTLGRYYRIRMSKFEEEFRSFKKRGDYQYWPFFKSENYFSQLNKPPFLDPQSKT